MPHITLVSAVMVLCLAIPSKANGQTAQPTPQVRITVKDSQHGAAQSYTGHWSVVTADSLTLVEELPSTTSHTFGRADIQEVEQRGRSHSSEGRGALIGFVSGAALVGILAAAEASSCTGFFCGSESVAPMAAGGALLGGLAGGLVGALVGSTLHHATWERTSLPGPEALSMMIQPIIAPLVHGLALGVRLEF